jgi:hypothetical protein
VLNALAADAVQLAGLRSLIASRLPAEAQAALNGLMTRVEEGDRELRSLRKVRRSRFGLHRHRSWARSRCLLWPAKRCSFTLKQLD